MLWEGIVETDRWFGPLFTNLRLTRTDRPVHLSSELPLLLVQPAPRVAYAEATLAASDFIPDMDGLTADGLGGLPPHHRGARGRPGPRTGRLCGGGAQAGARSLPVRGGGGLTVCE